MTRLEERLCDAYQAVADSVTREMEEPELTGTGRRAGRPASGSRAPLIRLAAPLAAAAAVAAIALATSLIATSGPSRKPNNSHGPAHWGLTVATRIAQGYPGGRIPAAAQPRYYLGIQPSPRGPTEYAFTVYVYSSATGQQTGQLTLPRSDLWARAVASLGNGAFVVAATKDWPRFGCRSWLYQFHLTAAGQPTGLTPFVVPQVSGWARQLAGSGDGQMAVLTTSACDHGRTQSMNTHDVRATAISLPSGATTIWLPWPAGSNLIPENTVSSATLSADGRLFAFTAIPGQPLDFGAHVQAYVMLTGHVSGPVARRYRLVLDPPGTATAIAAAPSPNGRVTFVMTARRYSGRWHEMIGAYATVTGKLLTVLASTSARYLFGDGYLMPDPSGTHLLVLGFGEDGNTAVLDIATHRLSALPVRYPYPPLGSAW